MNRDVFFHDADELHLAERDGFLETTEVATRCESVTHYNDGYADGLKHGSAGWFGALCFGVILGIAFASFILGGV